MLFSAEMGAALLTIEALFQSVTCIQRFWELSKWRYSRLTLMSSKQLAEHGDLHCWYVEIQQWFESYGINANSLPPFQYNLDCPHLHITKMEKNRVIWTDIINLENKIAWIIPKMSLDRKMAHYKTLFTHIRGWIHHQANLYGHTYILCAAKCYRAAGNFFSSVRDWCRKICMNISKTKNLSIVSSRSGIWRTLSL